MGIVSPRLVNETSITLVSGSDGKDATRLEINRIKGTAEWEYGNASGFHYKRQRVLRGARDLAVRGDGSSRARQR